MTAEAADHSALIAAGAQACFDAIIDFDTYPSWQSAVKRCAVLERDAEGRGTLVEFVIDARLREVRYVLRYSFDEPHAIRWDYVEGDVRSVGGDFTFEAVDGGTRATYRLVIDPGRWVPGPVKRLLTDQVMRTVVAELKARVEAG